MTILNEIIMLNINSYNVNVIHYTTTNLVKSYTENERSECWGRNGPGKKLKKKTKNICVSLRTGCYLLLSISHIVSARNIVSNKLAAKLNTKHLHSPPVFMTSTRLIYNETSEMKRAFFMMGIYGTAHNVRDMLSEFPVIASG